MRFHGWAFWLTAAILATSTGATWGQPAGSPNTVQAPVHPSQDQPAKSPPPAPHGASRKAASAKPTMPPVVPPNGPARARKPSSAATKPAQPTPTPPPAVAPSEAETPTVPPVVDKLADPEKTDGTPSHLPRFASLRSDDVNMRAGPGTRYRIDWVYRRRDLPVEIEREFDVWRWVRDPDGIQGWVHQATLMGRRSFIVQKTEAALRSEANDAAATVATLKPGVIGRIRFCEASSDWCSVQTGSYRGFLRRTQIWGLFPGEIINP